jgi:hypothetical protein
MALRERVRLVDPDEPIKLITYEDPAVDKDATPKDDAVAFLKSNGMDRSGLVLTADPTAFHVKPLTPAQSRDVSVAASAGVTDRQAGKLAALTAFWHACKLVSNWEFADGSRGDLPKDKWEEQLDHKWQMEIGQYVIRLSTLQPAKSKEDDVPKS